MSDQFDQLKNIMTDLSKTTHVWQNEISKSGDILKNSAKDGTEQLTKGIKDILIKLNKTNKSI